MVIGAFFSEVGTELLGRFGAFDANYDVNREKLIVTGDWSEHEFSGVIQRFRSYDCKIESRRSSLEDLRGYLMGKGRCLRWKPDNGIVP